MLFSTFILITINGKHDGLQKGINLRHGDQSTQMRNMSWLALQQKQQIPILLGLFIIWKRSLLNLSRLIKMTSNFFSLHLISKANFNSNVLTSSKAILF
jgi:hypothetical protein